MSATTHDFVHSTSAEPHRVRTQQILKQHPDVRKLIGTNPATFWWTLGIVGGQIGISYVVRNQSWWIVLGAAYLLGAFANHALFVIIHECTHKLVFRKKLPNTVTGFLANLPLAFPSYAGFAKYHLKHHAFQGVYELDADLPNYWEARLIGHTALGKALWLLLYPVFQFTRPFRLKEINLLDGSTLSNAAVQFAFDIAVVVFWGPKALVYFIASLFFSIGLHPLGARWIQRHYMTGGGDQETFSYYGPLNKLAFNVGYHNEHHDFPSVPWDRLPTLRSTAPEWYENLFSHSSWTRLLFRFLFDRDLSLFSRTVREERGRVKLDDEVKPDQDLIAAERPKA